MQRLIGILVLLGSMITFLACSDSGNGIDNTEPDENVESEKDKNYGMTENTAIKTLVSSVEYDNYLERNYIYVSGKYPSPPSSSEDYLEVGFCAGTSRYPKVTDISISESIERPSSNSVRTIGIDGELKSGTTYYIRPYHIEGTKIIYYQADSIQTIGKDIQLSLMLNKTSHNGGTISYNIKQNGTYKLTVSYWSIGGIMDEDLGYIEKGAGTKNFHFDPYVWDNYQYCSVMLQHIEKDIVYVCKDHLGWKSSGS